MTKEPHVDPVPPDVPPIESVPPSGTVPAQVSPAPVSPAGVGPGPVRPAQVKPVPIGRGDGKLSKRLLTAYFAGGIALLVAGTVAVFYLAVQVYGRPEPTTSVTIARGSPVTTSPSPVGPSGPLRARFGPERLANGKTFLVYGEGDAKFEVTVRTLKFRKSACSPYAVPAENGGYLPTELTVKVLEGEPEVTDYDFRFQQPDGTWLNAVGGSACDKGYASFVRRLVAGRTYRSTIVYDVPNTKGDVVFVYPRTDALASWRVG
ncbi:MAG: hypothetical protein ABW000_18805 [Actinoplanes sp.]